MPQWSSNTPAAVFQRDAGLHHRDRRAHGHRQLQVRLTATASIYLPVS